MLFQNREQAGGLLVERVARLGLSHPIVIGVGGGGAEVAAPIARELEVPLDVLLVARLPAPGQADLTLGVVAEGGVVMLEQHLCEVLGLSLQALEHLIAGAARELESRAEHLRRRPLPDLHGRPILVVLDGITSGVTAGAALSALRQLGASEVVLVTPVGASGTLAELRELVAQLICLEERSDFRSVQMFYRDFRPVDDEELIALVHPPIASVGPGEPSQAGEGLVIPLREPQLRGELALPPEPHALVVLAELGRRSDPANSIGAGLHAAGFGTLTVELLLPEEQAIDAVSGRLREEVELLATRLLRVVDWLGSDRRTAELPLVLLGSDEAGAAALLVAAARPKAVRALVTLSGRVDRVRGLSRVVAPTLFVVGGRDWALLRVTRERMDELGGAHDLEILEEAGRALAEPGAIARAASLAGRWFERQLNAPRPASSAARPATVKSPRS